MRDRLAVRLRGGRRLRDRAFAHARAEVGFPLLCRDPHEPDLRRGDAGDGLDLGEGLMGALVGVGRADAGLVPDRLPAVRDLPTAALRDRRPRAPGALRIGVRSNGGGGATSNLPWQMSLTFLVSLLGTGLLFTTLCKYELTVKHTRAQLRALRRSAERREGAGTASIPSQIGRAN